MTVNLGGTWALQQVATVADVTSATVTNALLTPGVKGYSLRVPWKLIDSTTNPGTWTQILDAGVAYCAAHNLALAIRFMAGSNTPDYVFNALTLHNGYYLSGASKAPTPFMADGTPNAVFETAFQNEVTALAAYCRANGVQELHMPWYGRLFAQYDNNASFVQLEPGYTYARWLTGHERLVDIAFASAGDDFSVEFPVDGNAGGFPTQADITSYTDSKAFNAGHSTWLYQQTNGLGGSFGNPPTGAHVPHAQQMDQPIDYDWDAIYASVKSNNLVYVEVYAASFANNLAHHASLLSNILAFAGSRQFRIGGTWDTTQPTHVFKGSFDEVAFYSVALGPDEILEHVTLGLVSRNVSFTKRVGKAANATLSFIGTFIHNRNTFVQALSATVSFAGAVTQKFNAHQLFQNLFATVTFSGKARKQAQKGLSASLTPAGNTRNFISLIGQFTAGLNFNAAFAGLKVRAPIIFNASMRAASQLTSVHWYMGVFRETSLGMFRALSRGLHRITKNRNLR